MKLNVIASKPAVNPKDVLIMEKYDFSAMVISSFLVEMGFVTRVVRKPENIIEEIKKQEPKILFYEWDQGAEADKELLKKIRNDFPNIEVVVIRHTAQKVSLDELFVYYKINKIVVRPFSRREVTKVVSQIK